MDDDVPPDRPQRERDQRERHQREAQILEQCPVADRLSVLALDRHRPRRREQGGDQRHRHVARIRRLELPDPRRHRHARLLFRQARGDLRIDHRPADDVDEIKKRQEEAGEHRRRVELDDRLAGDRGVDDDHHRGRDQDPERAAGRDHAGSELHVIARAQHRVERDDAHQHHDRAHEAAGNAPERAYDQRGNGQRRGHAPERELDAVEHLVHQRAALHHVAHEHEQRDGDQDVVGHRAVSALDHQIEDAIVHPGLAGDIERDEAEEYSRAPSA